MLQFAVVAHFLEYFHGVHFLLFLFVEFDFSLDVAVQNYIFEGQLVFAEHSLVNARVLLREFRLHLVQLIHELQLLQIIGGILLVLL